jgi:putative toxin-antitoxin system antitoxin component (TIGR02293 family)
MKEFSPIGINLLPNWQNPATLYPITMTRHSTMLPIAHPRHRITRYPSRGSSLGLAVKGTADLIHTVERGLPFRTFETFSAEAGLAFSTIASVIQIPERTLARRKSSGRLSPGESERLLRIANIFEKAVELFEGDVSEAIQWLTTPKKALGEHVPLPFSRTELGAREVENLIGRLEQGIFT